MSKAKLTSLLFLGFIGRIAETLTLFIAFLLFPAFLPLPPFLFVGAYLLCVPSFFFVLSDSVYFPHFYPDSSVFLPFVFPPMVKRDDIR